MTYRVRLFDGLPLPEYITRGDQQTMGSGSALTAFLQLPGGGYYDNYQHRKSPQGIRPISKSGLFYGTAAELRAELLAWRAKIGVRGRLTVEFDDGLLLWQWARLQDVDAPRPAAAKSHWNPVTFTWITAAQNWRSFVHEEGVWTWGDGEWAFGDGAAGFGVGVETFTLTSATQTVTVTHNGTIDAPNVALRFTIPAAWEIIRIVNETTGQNISMGRPTTAIGPLFELDAGARRMVIGDAEVTLASAVRAGNTVVVQTAAAHGLVEGMTVRLSGTGLYDGDYYPIYAISSHQFTILLRPDHTGWGTTTEGTARGLSDTYGRATVSDLNRWFVLAPGENDITVTWQPFPGTVTMTVGFDDHYG